VQDRDTGRDSRADLRMKLFDRRGRVRERALSMLTLRGRQAPGWMEDVIRSRQRAEAGRTAPAEGLFLVTVAYGP